MILLQKMAALHHERELQQVESFNERIELIEKKQKEMESTVGECKTSLEFTQGLIDDKIKDMDKALNEKIEGIKQTNEQQRLDGIGETEGENSEEIEDKVQMLFKNRLIITKDIDIERMGPYTAQDNARPWRIIFKLLNYKDKLLILKYAIRLKDTNIYINDDFSDTTKEIRKELRVQMKKDRENGKFSRIVYDRLITKEFKEKNTGEN
ncbi:uncharacterized protein LOC130630097 [Hydractinia symbiolongicarpus]|uniref:uncharacterized protein LOC130630097 n=1 Tax=Hydractinia symbiolongicarpus TaxID=13093 RepID=UPI00254C238D|nr:uncharacterized protein LOC130630097 [Hydractinia symbiolongicarpus]